MGGEHVENRKCYSRQRRAYKEKFRKEKLQKTVYENFPGGPVAGMPCS